MIYADNTIAISVGDYLKYGCPSCGYLPPICLREDWTLINELGDIGICPCCRTLFVVTEQEAEEGNGKPINSGLMLTVEGLRSFSPKLLPHPRKETPYNQEFDSQVRDMDDLPGTWHLPVDTGIQINAA